MNIPMTNIVGVSDIQKDYRRIFELAKNSRQPVVIMRGNKPDVAIVDFKMLEKLDKKLEEIEIADTLKAIKEGEIELRNGKTKIAKSLSKFL